MAAPAVLNDAGLWSVVLLRTLRLLLLPRPVPAPAVAARDPPSPTDTAHGEHYAPALPNTSNNQPPPPARLGVMVHTTGRFGLFMCRRREVEAARAHERGGRR